MKIHHQAGFILASAAAILGLTGCTSGGQSGPLQFGNDEGTVDSRLCGPNARKSHEIFYAQTATNPTDKELEIVGLSLLKTHNVTQKSDLAVVLPETEEPVFYIHFEDPADEGNSGAMALIGQMQLAEGFSIPANATVLLSVRASIDDPESHTSVSQMAIEYKANGKKFVEKNGMSWQTKDSACGE
ncbi:hypothetical protein [Paeniglutamicibacter kerguelensis]|uniref:Lipoprotein n=1 Tax=Paeniglutamicibacter kerguelensis TaxID=254788 RepID=A0ABS4X8T2_9MICC|nr:hypothetical protein [Paeniglutamicibacter kerguelensis]MBP2384716.1 hypothetical protein [Paeniglutamicibacter kerguelensis]